MAAHAYTPSEVDEIVDWADGIADTHVPRRLAIALWEEREAARHARRLAAAPQPPAAQRGLALVGTDDICPRCGGSGEITIAGHSISPSAGIPIRDPQCDETGTCPTCHGRGAI